LKKLFVGGHNPSGTIFGSSGPGIKACLAEHFELLESIEDLSPDDFYVALDASKSEIRALERKQIPASHRALIAFEPEVVLPWQTKDFAERNFSFSRWVGRPKSPTSEYWPQIFEMGEVDPSNEVDCTMMTSNKLSFVKGELYSLRRDAIRNVPGLRLVGSGWRTSVTGRTLAYLRSAGFHIAQGRFLEAGNFDYLTMSADSEFVESKQQWLSKSRVSLVFENSCEYSSEKAFDCLRAFSIPVYVGAANSMPASIEDLIFRARPNINSVLAALELVKTVNYEQWSERVAYALSNEELRSTIEERSVFSRLSRGVADWAHSSS
jgi:hypothetical protein